MSPLSVVIKTRHFESKSRNRRRGRAPPSFPIYFRLAGVLWSSPYASCLPHLYPVQLSHPFSLLNHYTTTSSWNRTTMHKKYRYVCDPRVPSNNETFPCTFMCYDMYWHRSASEWEREKVFKLEFKNVFDISLCLGVPSWLRRKRWLPALASSHCKRTE